NKMHGKLIALFAKYNLDYKKWGEDFGQALVKGLESAEGEVEKAAEALAKAVRKYFPSSPAEKGPMKDLDHWMDAFVPVLMQGVDFKALDRFMEGGMSGMGFAGRQMGANYGAGLARSLGGNAGGSATIIFANPTLIGTGLGQAAQELTPHIRKELNRVGISNVGVGLE
ncbi:MAG TPA: hypothetical protein VH593_25690, partial [Ktedonobacteraceae bacterium]